jgi:hypothetical protein
MLICAVMLVVSSAPSGSAELAKGRELVRGLKYSEALKPLAAAQAAPDSTRETLCEAYELEGVVLATLKRPADAIEAFKRLLVLSPQHAFATERSPRVMTPYYEARGWLKLSGPLELTVRDERRPDGTLVLQVALNDPLSMAQGATLALTEDGAVREVKLAHDTLPTAVESHASDVEVRASLRSPRDQTLWSSAALSFVKPMAAPAFPPVPPLEAPPPVPPLTVVDATPAPASHSKTLRGAAIGVFVGGAVSAGLGTFLGVRSSQGRTSFNQSLMEQMQTGASGLSRDDAQSLSNSVQQNAWAANVLFAAAGALVITAVVLFILGS